MQRELILAQITLQELEDAREEALGRLAESERRQSELQSLADHALADRDHLESAHRELRAHRDHFQHVLHVTNEALNATRDEVSRLGAELAARAAQLSATTEELTRARAQVDSLGNDLASSQQLAGTRAERIAQLDAELRTMKTSRSWRWTAWLRSLERAWHRFTAR